ncbi:hypothetical protein K438DRAFT_1782348 [Mycena galopus ATCC 62051]|nr:hypothetical protein K438DRAFT_1782348 [Mycena galopus ATCC 62051]
MSGPPPAAARSLAKWALFSATCALDVVDTLGDDAQVLIELLLLELRDWHPDEILSEKEKRKDSTIGDNRWWRAEKRRPPGLQYASLSPIEKEIIEERKRKDSAIGNNRQWRAEKRRPPGPRTGKASTCSTRAWWSKREGIRPAYLRARRSHGGKPPSTSSGRRPLHEKEKEKDSVIGNNRQWRAEKRRPPGPRYACAYVLARRVRVVLACGGPREKGQGPLTCVLKVAWREASQHVVRL